MGANYTDLGGLIFIDLRDRTGVVQTVLNPTSSEKAPEIAETIRNAFVISITGEVIGEENNKLIRIWKQVQLKFMYESYDY